MNKPENLLKEYAEAAAALTDWFVSQEIDVPRSCGIMCFLTGISIAEASDGVGDCYAGLKRHVNVMSAAALMTLDKKRGR